MTARETTTSTPESFPKSVMDNRTAPSLLNPAGDSLMLALEPRLLFDAAGLIAGLDILPEQTDSGPDPDLFSDPVAYMDPVPSSVAPLSAVIFIDPGVTDYEHLISEISGDTQVVLLDQDTNGITQISDILSQYQNVGSVHIISHGAQGSITLGDAVLSNDTIDEYATDLQEWGSSLAGGADILVYGCNVSSGVEGQSFVAQLSDITGADVAASDDITGAANKGGDWDLETRTGIIETGVVFSDTLQQTYTGTLADIVVNSVEDNTTADAYTTLREALVTVNGNAEADTITFDASLDGKTITLDGSELEITAAEGVTINGDIDGDGSGDITISGNNASRVFNIGNSGNAILNRLSITDGHSNGKGGGIYNKGGDLTIENSTISGNDTDSFGGGIYNKGTLTVNNSTIWGNTSWNSGGGIYSGGTLTVNNSTISGNSSNVRGGGILNWGDLYVNNSTVAYNSSPASSAIYTDAFFGRTELGHTIVVGDLTNKIFSQGYNLFTQAAVTGFIASDLLGANADLGALAGNGGPTLTHALGANSDALDAGDPSGVGFPTYDQRGTGFTRVDGGRIDIGAVEMENNAPIANDDGFTTDQDTPLATGNLLDNDLDPDIGDTLTVSAVNDNTTKGTVSFNADGTFTYDPDDQFDYLAQGDSATDAFTYTVSDGNSNTDTATVTITITGENDNPEAGSDNFATNQDTAFTTGNVLDNDTDPDTSDTLTMDSIDTTGTKGAVTDNGNGTFDYDPNGQFDYLAQGDSATDAFTYTISDGNGCTNTAAVTITVTGVNKGPTAADDSDTTNEETAFTTINVIANDSDPGPSDTFFVSGLGTTGTKGTVTNNGDGTFTYDPSGRFNNLSDGGTAADIFTYTVSDGNGNTDTATVTITITGVNDNPEANNDAYSVNPDTAFTFGNVLANDTDPDASDTLSVESVYTSDTKGIVTHNGDGTFSYDPNGQFDDLGMGETATDTFIYAVSDGNGGSDPAVVTITITGNKEIPTGNDDSFTTSENTAISMDVLANDTHPDGSGSLTVSGYDTTATQGIVTGNGDGTFTYNPNGQFDDLGVGETATDTFTYTVSDGSGGTDTATVTITISGIKKDGTGLIFRTPTADASFADLITDPQKFGTPWYQIWTGNEAGSEGDYVDTTAFHANGNGWIQGDDLAGLFPDYCQADDTALWVRSWTQAGGFSAWDSSNMPFDLIDSVNTCDSVTGPMPMDQMFNDENASSDHWYRIWIGDSAGQDAKGSFLDTADLNNGAGMGWVRASELADMSFTPDEPGISQELWVQAWSPAAGNLGWEHWTVTCTQETTAAAVLEQNIDLTGTNKTESFAIADYVKPETHWQQIFNQTDETGTQPHETIGVIGFNEQLQTTGNRFEAQRKAFLERLS